MNAAFTIVAKNYLSLANALMNSIRQHNPDCKLFVFVADEFEDDQSFDIEDCTIIESKDIAIPNFHELAFKYNVTEFCTAIKPFCFEFLDKKYHYDKIVFFDPDVYMFDDINIICNDLGDKLCLLTPHYFTPQVNYTGAVPEEMILWVGIFNLGFIAINMQHKYTAKMLDWWKNRLASSCYADKQDGLHTDQKWLDYLPSYFPDDVKVSHNMGYNLSVWNLHERIIEENAGKFVVRNLIDRGKTNDNLIFIHFSGFDIKNKQTIHKHHPILNTINRPEMAEVLEMYRKSLLSSGYEKAISWKYSYGMFKNGVPIILFQRRLFRRLLSLNEVYKNPFDVNAESFYARLKKDHLITKENTVDKQTAANIASHSKKIKLIFNCFRVLNRLLGIDKYALLLKFLSRYSRPENQTFLLDDWMNKYEFYNENVRTK